MVMRFIISRQLEHRWRNLDRIRAAQRVQARERRATDPAYAAADRARCRDWAARNAEHKSAYNASWNAAHVEDRRACHSRWREANADHVRIAQRDHQQARRARKREAFVEPVPYLVLAERDGWVCGLCHEAVEPTRRHPDPLSGSVDHVVALVNGGLHEMANAQLAHLDCNLHKGKR